MMDEPSPDCICGKTMDDFALWTAAKVDGAITATRTSKEWLCPEHGKMKAHASFGITFPRTKKAIA